MWLAASLFGLAALLTRLLSVHDAWNVTLRVAPVLVFLVAVTVLAELSDAAELFDVAAARAARLARGRTWLLYLLVLLLATGTTIVLSLDTTAALLTPVVLSLAAQLDRSPRPFAFAAVWLANTASLLLPVSNLTNLLAIDRLGLSTAAYVSRMLLPALAVVLVTWIALYAWHRRRLRGRFVVPPPRRPADRPLFVSALVACLVLVPALLAGLPVAVAASVAAAVVVVAFAVRRREALRWHLIPWRLVMMVEGLFLVVSAVGPHGLDTVLHSAAGSGTSFLAHLRVAGTAAIGANLANNLPAYLALERVVPRADLVDVLMGVNLGPLVLPWGSLATLLWLERCRARNLRISPRSFALSGVAVVPVLLVTSVAAARL